MRGTELRSRVRREVHRLAMLKVQDAHDASLTEALDKHGDALSGAIEQRKLLEQTLVEVKEQNRLLAERLTNATEAAEVRAGFISYIIVAVCPGASARRNWSNIVVPPTETPPHHLQFHRNAWLLASDSTGRLLKT